MNKINYSKRDHDHCPQTNSPCGFEGEHRCCLCKKPVDTSDNWQERFDMAFPSIDEGDTPIPLTSKRFLEWQSTRDKAIKQFIAKEKERSREEVHQSYHGDSKKWVEAGKAAMLASVREKLFTDDPECEHGFNPAEDCKNVHCEIRYRRDLLNTLSTLE